MKQMTEAQKIANRKRAAAWYWANLERARARQRAIGALHRDEKREYDKMYRGLQGETRRAKQRAYYVANRRKFREYRVANRDRLAAYMGAYRANNRELYRHHQQLRIAREANAHGSHTIEQWLEKCDLFAWCCAYCGEARPLVREHRIPLTRDGSNDIRNIVPACRSCNSSKRQMTDREFIAFRSSLQ